MLSNTKSFVLLAAIFCIIYISNYYWLKNKYKQPNFNYLLMNNIMGCIFIVFGVLKLINLSDFVNIFNKYDVISQKIPTYAYLYPFVEIALGVAYLKKYRLRDVNLITLFLMIISIFSVMISLPKGQKLRCGCLGSFFHIPLSYVTLSENIAMGSMSAYSLYLAK